MKITLTSLTEDITALDRDDYSWTWDREASKFRHESSGEALTIDELLATRGPLLVCVDGLRSGEVQFDRA